MLFTETFIGEGSEFMDHREVQVETSEDAAGAGVAGHNCGPAGLPRSPALHTGALVPIL
jgi:hypothetical protein